jgi:deferrochelatase/peroxidase EfeB
MKPRRGGSSNPTRRGLVQAAASLAAAGSGLATAALATAAERDAEAPRAANVGGDIEPYWGEHQGGITTPAQRHSYFAAFDLMTPRRDDIVTMLRHWTAAGAAMAAGKPAAAYGPDGTVPARDSGDALGLGPARLTLTFGFGIGLFDKGGQDRYGLRGQRPPALVEMPPFSGDQLEAARTGGDLSIQACAEDPQVTFHAVRQLARLAQGTAGIRWAQAGYVAKPEDGATPRNLIGFKDGTGNPSPADAAAMAAHVWIGEEGPAWLRGGSYVVVRRIRIALERWDRMPLGLQEQAIGRHKYSGAPLGGKGEFDPLDLAATDAGGDPIIPQSAHIRLAAAASNGGAQILRRPYSYNDGADFTTERWAPWRQGVEYDAGLLFVCYQRDPRTGFIRIFDKLAKFDLLNQFVTHTGGGLFACPAGIAKGEFIGERLFDLA